MIRSPSHKSSYGQRTTAFAESLDFYRTLNGLAINANANANANAAGGGGHAVTVEDGVEGADLTPLFVGPFSADASQVQQVQQVHNASFSQMARCPASGLGPESACNSVTRADTAYMGYSVRVDEYRYTAWLAFNGTLNRADWAGVDAPSPIGTTTASSLMGEELYSHVGDTNGDFDAFENENLAMQPEHKDTRDELFAMLRARFDTPPRV